LGDLADGDFGDTSCLELFLEVLDIFLDEDEELSLELLRERLRSGVEPDSTVDAESNGTSNFIGFDS